MTRRLNATLLVNTTDPAMFSRAVDAMSRTLAGLGLEGIDGPLMVDQDDEDDEEEA